ncbi:hypothetical protein G210_1890 [Candida maltosa Xu316]|uniref:DUF2415 domain-containing protein n=1 Tax=Candida maltosa (strain Xu316) TaxID=1245528 RepID=M3JZ46_CANMX|nr:hypothetical protein G210_1890 [Candida maltosa Xu316]
MTIDLTKTSNNQVVEDATKLTTVTSTDESSSSSSTTKPKKVIYQSSSSLPYNDNFNKRRKSKASAKHFNTIYHQYNKCFQNYYHGYQFLKPNGQYLLNLKPSVNHWQLRDLIKFNNATNDIYYSKDDSIFQYNVNNYHFNNYIKLNYYPRCFDHEENYIVTGGLLTTSSKIFSLNLQNLTYESENTNGINSASVSRRISKGLFSFYNPDLNQLNTVKIGEMINNDVKLYKSGNNQFKSYICNNDTNLYCLDINHSNFKCVNKINCEVNTCLNNVTKNPQNDKILTATGDSSSIFLIDPTTSKPIIKSINSGHESGFGVDYHSNGLQFSTVFQDGICQIYDLRNLSRSLAEIKSTRPGHQSGAFRVVKFSSQNDLNDLLIISEHVGRVHLIDLRNLNDEVNNHQVIVVPAALNKFAEYKSSVYNNNNDQCEDDDFKPPINIYNNSYDDELSFTAPLVYDYDYLTNTNPKLFKNFNYTPPPPSSTTMPSEKHEEKPTLNTPQWTSSSSENITHQQHQPVSPRSSTSYDIDSQLNDIYMEYNPTNISVSSSYSNNNNYCDDSYQQSSNHIHGEMELSGIEFINANFINDSKIIIGCQDSGMIVWDINGISRRSIGSFDFV